MQDQRRLQEGGAGALRLQWREDLAPWRGVRGDTAATGVGTGMRTGLGMRDAVADVCTSLGPGLDQGLMADRAGLVAIACLAPLNVAPRMSGPSGLVHVQALVAVIETVPLIDTLEITGIIARIAEL